MPVSSELAPFLYALLAPIYDPFAVIVSRNARRDAIQQVVASPGDHILVAGCGTGLSLPTLSRRVPDGWVESVDRSPAMLARARQRVRRHSLSNVGLRQANLLDVPYSNHQFDAALSAYVLDVLPPPERRAAIRELWRILRPGGRVVLVTPALPQTPIGQFWSRIAQHAPALLGGSEPADLRPLVQRAGFRVTSLRRSRSGTLPSAVLTARRPHINGSST